MSAAIDSGTTATAMTGEAAASGLLGSIAGARILKIGASGSLVVEEVRFVAAIAQPTRASTSATKPGRIALHSADSP